MVGLNSQTRPLSDVSVKHEPCFRRDEKESEINHAEFPAEAPESNADERETYNAQQSMYDLSGHSGKQIAFVEKHESCDRPNYQRATDEQYHGNSMWAFQCFEIAAGLMRYSLKVVHDADDRPARTRQGEELRVRDRSTDRIGP